MEISPGTPQGTPGRMKTLRFKPGDSVKTGEVIAIIA
jgi:hypothetical protein